MCTVGPRPRDQLAGSALGWEGRVAAFYGRRAKADRWAAEVTLEGCWR